MMRIPFQHNNKLESVRQLLLLLFSFFFFCCLSIDGWQTTNWRVTATYWKAVCLRIIRIPPHKILQNKYLTRNFNLSIKLHFQEIALCDRSELQPSSLPVTSSCNSPFYNSYLKKKIAIFEYMFRISEIMKSKQTYIFYVTQAQVSSSFPL